MNASKCAAAAAERPINALAIILTAKVLGLQLGVARAVGAVVFSIVIGAAMHLFFRHEERAKAASSSAACWSRGCCSAGPVTKD